MSGYTSAYLLDAPLKHRTLGTLPGSPPANNPAVEPDVDATHGTPLVSEADIRTVQKNHFWIKRRTSQLLDDLGHGGWWCHEIA